MAVFGLGGEIGDVFNKVRISLYGSGEVGVLEGVVIRACFGLGLRPTGDGSCAPHNLEKKELLDFAI